MKNLRLRKRDKETRLIVESNSSIHSPSTQDRTISYCRRLSGEGSS